MTGRGYTASSHVVRAFVTSSKTGSVGWVHSTDIASAVDAERLPEIKAALVDHVVVERHGGRSTRSPTGDEMMAVLGGRPRSALALTRPGTLCRCTM